MCVEQEALSSAESGCNLFCFRLIIGSLCISLSVFVESSHLFLIDSSCSVGSPSPCACLLESAGRSGSDHVLGPCAYEDIKIIFPT